MAPIPCNARNREWYRCEVEDGHHGDHWSLEGGRWSETLTISGDANNVYLSDETGRIVVSRPATKVQQKNEGEG